MPKESSKSTTPEKVKASSETKAAEKKQSNTTPKKNKFKIF